MGYAPRVFWVMYRYVGKFFRWVYQRIFPQKVITEMIERSVEVKKITDRCELNTLFPPIMWYINLLTTPESKDTMTISMEATKDNTAVAQQVPKNRTAKLNFLDHEIRYTSDQWQAGHAFRPLRAFCSH